jgi:hypothetical protein
MIARGICREPDQALVCWIAIQLCPGGQSLLEEFMIIRFGYDIIVHCEAPTPMVCLMDVRPEYHEQMVSEEQVITTPHVPTHTYVDMFGNVCRRFTAPQGDFSIWADGVVRDSGLHDPLHADAAEVPVEDLPDDCLAFLVGSRYCETDMLSQTAWRSVRKYKTRLVSCSGRVRLCAQPPYIRLRECPSHSYGDGSL